MVTLNVLLKSYQISIPRSLRIAAFLATKGSPFLLHLIGHSIVAHSSASRRIDTHERKNAIFAAMREYKEDVCKPTLAALSDTDVLFLQALAEIGSPAKMSEIAQSLEDQMITFKNIV